MDGLGVLVGILVLCWFLPGRCAAAGVALPVFCVSQSAESLKKLERTVAPLMAMSEDELIALVPDRTGFRYVACAGCCMGVRERQLDWSIDDPFRVRLPPLRSGLSRARVCGEQDPAPVESTGRRSRISVLRGWVGKTIFLPCQGMVVREVLSCGPCAGPR